METTASKMEVSDDKELASKYWDNFAPPADATPFSHRKMPKLLSAGRHDDYSSDFLDTVERIGIICDCLEKLESLCQHVKKDGIAKRSKWAKAAEAFQHYGDDVMTKSVAEVFQRAAKKFTQISVFYQYVTETIENHFHNTLRQFNHNDVKAVKESLKKLDNSRKVLNNAKNKAERKPELEQKITAEVAEKMHKEQLKATEESVLKFLEATSFFQEAATAFISAEKELSDKAHQAILKIIYTY